jgi:UDP-N-acetylglucosamine 2-epimerase (non-hydrolysing)
VSRAARATRPRGRRTARPRVMVVIGTRPEAIKLAPVARELERRRFDVRVCATGQHSRLLDQTLDELGLVPDQYLSVMRANQTLPALSARLLRAMARVMAEWRPDLVVVQGDTTSSFVGALTAFYQRVPVAHVEAGLRTGQRYSPWPEELNRALVGRLATLHFAPTPAARANLEREGIAARDIHVTGNTGIDSLRWAARQPLSPRARRWLPAAGRRLVLVTAHRRESFGAPLEAICAALAELAADPRLEVVYPVHPNPNVRGPVRAALGGLARVHLVSPLPYLEFVQLMKRAAVVVTDSGGVQEEAPYLGRPVIVIRETTERREGVRSGHAVVVGTDARLIVREARRALARRARPRARGLYGDGRAARRIVDVVQRLLRDGARP